MKTLIQKINFTTPTQLVFDVLKKNSAIQKLYLIISRKAYVLYTQKTFTSLMIPVPNLQPLVQQLLFKSLIRDKNIIFPLKSKENKNDTKDNDLKANQKTQKQKVQASLNVNEDMSSISLSPLKLQFDRKHLQNLGNVYEHIQGFSVNEQSRFLAIDNQNNLFVTNYKKPEQIHENSQSNTKQNQQKSQQSFLKQQNTQSSSKKQKLSQLSQNMKISQQIKFSSENHKYLALLTNPHKQQSKIQIQYIQTGYQYLFSNFLKIFVLANVFTCFAILTKLTRYENNPLIKERAKR